MVKLLSYGFRLRAKKAKAKTTTNEQSLVRTEGLQSYRCRYTKCTVIYLSAGMLIVAPSVY